MSKKLTFVDTEVRKNAFYKSKYLMDINYVNTVKIVKSNQVSFSKKGFKYFLGYKDDKIELLCIMLPKMNGFAKYLDETKYMSFLVEY